MTDLILPLKAEYFNSIKAGEKLEEYRLATPFWQKRLDGKVFDKVILSLGYPKREDADRRIVRKFAGWQLKEITHPHFGPDPVTVYAIDVSKPCD